MFFIIAMIISLVAESLWRTPRVVKPTASPQVPVAVMPASPPSPPPPPPSHIGVESVMKGSEVERKAVVLSRPEPRYTAEARAHAVSGEVVLRCILAADGRVTNITPIQRLPYGLTEQAIEAAQQVTFKPAEKDGRVVSQYVTMRFVFNIY
jgi:TonB family protein